MSTVKSDADFWEEKCNKIDVEVEWRGFTSFVMPLPYGYEHDDVMNVHIDGNYNQDFDLHIQTTDEKVHIISLASLGLDNEAIWKSVDADNMCISPNRDGSVSLGEVRRFCNF